MKSFLNLLVLAIALGSVSAHAMGAAPITEKRWPELVELDQNYRIDIRWKRWGGVPVANLCADGEIYRTLEPVKVCDEYQRIEVGHGKDRSSELVCVRESVRDLALPASEKQSRCVEWSKRRHKEDSIECVRFEDYLFTFPATNPIEIYAARGGRDRDPALLGVKDYTIPACAR